MTSEEPAFKIKTGNLPLLQLYINTTDMTVLKAQLIQRLNQTPDFFANTPIVLELSGIAQCDEALNFAELKSFMLELSMCAAGVVGGSQAQRAAAVKLGLGLFPEVPVRNPLRRATDDVLSVTGRHATVTQTQLFPPEEAARPPVAAVPPPVIIRPTMLVDKPVRAGQRIYAEGANLVVLAIVNAGAELIADGDIHVYAPMRGKAIAGARGNEAARIFVQSLEAELLSIAGCFKVFEDGIPDNVNGKPAQVHLEGSRLLISSLLY
ncbi:MAG: septum site-determining protein MinC [Gallionellales bacterium RIFOXYB12_FULL_54_9]|nr:MAG: septum site-determining protein MinC [Gallionellales bacterium RIFOXYB12_FULL_54_9]